MKKLILILSLFPIYMLGAGITTSATNGVASGLTLLGSTTNQGLISGGTLNIATNQAPISFISNPLTSGGLYTNSNQRAFITVTVNFTSVGQEIVLTNFTSHQYRGLKGSTGINASTGMLISPNDVLVFTNVTGSPTLGASEWDGI